MTEPTHEETTQKKIDNYATWGAGCAMVWGGGIFSLIAVMLGMAALRLIKQSGGKAQGGWVAWFSVVLGGFGVFITLAAIVIKLAKMGG